MAETVRRCVFCNQRRLATDPPEHVFPQWVSRVLKKLPGEGAFQVHFSQPGVPDRSCSVVEITTDSVCAGCNHGWMSDLESIVSPIMSAAILGNTTVFPAKSAPNIATWLVKTALMMDCAWGDLGAQRLAPDRHCRDLYRQRTPRNSTYGWSITVGYDPRSQGFRDGWMASSRLQTEGKLTRDRFDGYAITWHYGYLGFQVVCLGVDDQSLNSASRADLILPDGQQIPAASFTRQIYPFASTDVAWPPPVGLEQVGLAVFAQQPPFVTGIRSLN